MGPSGRWSWQKQRMAEIPPSSFVVVQGIADLILLSDARLAKLV